MSGQLVFNMIEDLLATDINAEQVGMRIKPRTAGCTMEASGNHPLSIESCGPKVNIAM